MSEIGITGRFYSPLLVPQISCFTTVIGISETEGWLQAVFYPQNGGEDHRLLWYDRISHLSEVKLWWAPASDDKGKS